MAKGGARNRSGPQKDPNSLRSAQAGLQLTALPAEGYSGEVPELTDFLVATTGRHEAIWSQLWTTPQACAWATESWRWPIIADLVELRARIDDPEAPAALVTSIRQLRDDLGLSAAGLKANGWAIAVNQVEKKRQERTDSTPKKSSARDRMKVVANVDGA